VTFQLLVGIALALWLASLAACAFAWRWSFSEIAKRFVASVILCLTALAIGYPGLTHFHLTASKTVNGRTQWSFDSHWFFIATLILAALTLAYTIWKHQRTAPPQSQPG
jgi:hypothetical protein